VQVIDEQRVNMAEMSTADDLWTLLDVCSSRLGWANDDTLRSGMMLLLKQMLSTTHQDWLHRHLNTLLK
jgi:hypothetical protein